MTDALIFAGSELAWPLALAVAWVAGEIGFRWLHLPRISSYGIAGFVMASSQGGFLPNPADQPIARLADFAFALMLFELGYRINLRWLLNNRWLAATSIMEAASTFALVFWVGRIYDLSMVPALLLAALSMSTSPAAVLRVVNEARSSGQVTERVLHLCALNCVSAVVVFKAVIGYSMLTTSGPVFEAIWNSLIVVVVSAGLGTLFGVVIAALLRPSGGLAFSATLVFALATLVLTTLSHALQFSPLLSALTFGVVARHRRIVLDQAQRNFGTLGDFLTVLLFVYVAAIIDWRDVADGIDIALTVVAARLVAKVVSTTMFARLSATTWRKGMLTGIGLAPLSVFVILLLDQTRYLNLDVLRALSGVAALVLVLEIFGPLLTHWALIWSGETQPREEQ